MEWRTLVPGVLVIVLLFLSGCTSGSVNGQEIGQGPVRAHFEHTGDWSVGMGCFEKVTGYAFNTGNATVQNAVLGFNLVDIRSGLIRDSRSVYLGTLNPGQSRTFESDLEGECLPDYRVDAVILSGS